MRLTARTVLLSGLVAVATAVTALVAGTPATAAPPPDVTPVKVAATRIGEGHAVYVRGTDGRLYWRTVEEFTAPGYSTAWRALPGGTVGSGPDAVQEGGELVWLAARATNGNLLVRRQDGTSFGSWVNLGGVITTAPAMALQSSTGDLWAFARGGDGAVWYRIRGGSGVWSPWQSLGGIVTAAPDPVVGTDDGVLRVFARGGDGTLYRRVWQPPGGPGGWGPWERIGVPINSATSSDGSDVVSFATHFRGANRHVYLLIDTGTRDLGGIATSAPDGTYGGEVVAVAGTDRALYARTDTWRRLGGVVA